MGEQGKRGGSGQSWWDGWFGRLLAGAWVLAVASGAAGAEWAIAAWDFNSVTPDSSVTTGTLEPAKGWGSLGRVGGVRDSFGSGYGSSDPAVTDNSDWRLSGWPAQGTGNKLHGIEIRINTLGWQPLRLEWDQYVSAAASRYWRVQYTTDGVTWRDGPVLAAAPEVWTHGLSVDLSWVLGAADNPRFGLRLVSEFEATALGRGAAAYVAASPLYPYATNGWLRLDQLRVWGLPTLERWSVLTWNLAGFGMTNWTPTHPQLQAIERILRALRPLVVSFQEVPEGWEAAMTNWVRSWWPEATVVVGSRTDGAVRLALASGLPVRAVRSWLRRVPLQAWGADAVFTRELLEAELVVPGFPEPVHTFAVHLKAGADVESAVRRAAEARAISNFFAVEWPARGRGRAYWLAGDCNEDIRRPRAAEQGAVQILLGGGTGLRLLSPVQAATGDDRTWSSWHASLSYRFDYLLPSGLLWSNVLDSGVFRSDREWPRPAGVEEGDSALASDHLPVWAVFANPFLPPRLSWELGGTSGRLRWWSGAGQRYRIEMSPDLQEWSAVAEMRVTGPGWAEYGLELSGGRRFYRVVRLP